MDDTEMLNLKPENLDWNGGDTLNFLEKFRMFTSVNEMWMFSDVS